MKQSKTLTLIRDELREFADEFEVTDSGWTQILFNKHVSKLINKGVIRTNKLPRKVGLTEIIEFVLRSDKSALDSKASRDEIVKQAEIFDNTIHNYRGEPDEEDMEDAERSLKKVIEILDNSVTNAR